MIDLGVAGFWDRNPSVVWLPEDDWVTLKSRRIDVNDRGKLSGRVPVDSETADGTILWLHQVGGRFAMNG